MALEEIFPDYAALAAQGFPGLACPRRTVMIAFSPRTGSTHLCAALHLAGQRAEPGEIFNPRGPARYESGRRQASSFSDYMASLAAGPDKVFIFKTCWQDAAPLAPALNRLFPDLQVVYLSRRNDAAQAISAFKAELTGIWHQRLGSEEVTQVHDGQFSMERLLAIHASQERERQGWQRWFVAQGIKPLALQYEEFEQDINAGLRKLVQSLGLGLRTEVPGQTGLEKLADQISHDWTQRLQRRLLNLG